MTAGKFTVPDWGQSVIAAAARLDPKELSVCHENDVSIVFLEHKTGKRYLISKKNGTVIVC